MLFRAGNLYLRGEVPLRLLQVSMFLNGTQWSEEHEDVASKRGDMFTDQTEIEHFLLLEKQCLTRCYNGIVKGAPEFIVRRSPTPSQVIPPQLTGRQKIALDLLEFVSLSISFSVRYQFIRKLCSCTC